MSVNMDSLSGWRSSGLNKAESRKQKAETGKPGEPIQLRLQQLNFSRLLGIWEMVPASSIVRKGCVWTLKTGSMSRIRAIIGFKSFQATESLFARTEKPEQAKASWAIHTTSAWTPPAINMCASSATAEYRFSTRTISLSKSLADRKSV